MSELHAALGLLTMSRVDEALDIRLAHVARYRHALDGAAGVGYQSIRGQDRSTYKDFALVFADLAHRDAVERALAVRDVQTKRYFKPCHRMAAFRSINHRELPVTEAMHDRILCIPLFESLTNDEIDLISTTICDAL